MALSNIQSLLVEFLSLLSKKPDGRFYLYINYQDLNNLIIKNQYLLLLQDCSIGYAKSNNFFRVHIIKKKYKKTINKRRL